jgi:phosphoribosylformimino-5-aminoimidazole carboxamide ribotide isomerase
MGTETAREFRPDGGPGMLILPAIDLLGGKAVRLSKGVEASAVVYSDRPEAVAEEFEAAGARWIHVVDLDAAFGRPHMNDATVERILRSVNIPIELGGGVRDEERIRFWLGKGVGRVILGSAAVENPELVRNATQEYGNESVVVGIDIRDGRVAVRGWTEDSARDYLDLARDMQKLGARRVIVTDISTDGMLGGPRLESMLRIARETVLSVVVSGGVGSIKDLEEIAGRRESAGRGIEGVIVGKALYEKRFSLREAIHRFQEKTGDRSA